tara:strand:- start:402 stop:644 length:243 start_codon:yes stop_codon:yes gene_type:complete
MSEENESEMMLLMKELVNKVKQLEKAVYDKDNLLMKSGYVVVDSPTPRISGGDINVETDKIAKMEWEQINEMVSRIEGGY